MPRAKAMRKPLAQEHVIVVLGYHELGDDGSHGLSAVCRAAVRRAEALAERQRPGAVIFTGWSSTGGPSEADQMAEAWRGRRDVPLIREPQAVNTAENAVRSLALVRELPGASVVEVVCSIRHFPRVRFLFTRLYRRHGLAPRYRYVLRPLPTPSLIVHEVCSMVRMGRDRRQALRLLDDQNRRRLSG
jgi:uncharacterized SAM-binding protein YcdF (DUF218 family)